MDDITIIRSGSGNSVATYLKLEKALIQLIDRKVMVLNSGEEYSTLYRSSVPCVYNAAYSFQNAQLLVDTGIYYIQGVGRVNNSTVLLLAHKSSLLITAIGVKGVDLTL